MPILSVAVSQSAVDNLGWQERPLSERLKRAIKQALALGLTPEMHRPDDSDTVASGVALSGSDEQRLRAVPVDPKAGYSLTDIAAGCIEAYSRHHRGTVTPGGGSNWIDGPRAEQKKLCQLMADSHEKGEVLFLEASTGVGKGRAIAAHAAHLIKTNASQRVVLAAPTIEIVGQLYAEYKTLQHGAPRVASMVGLGEFVSETALREVLNSDDASDLPDLENAQAWLKRGARQPWGRLGKRWLCDSLADAAPGFPVALVRLNHYQRTGLSANDDAGLRAYEKCSADARDCRILFCTHTMLALDVVKRLYLSRDDGIDHGTRKKYDTDEKWWHADLAARAEASNSGLLPNYDTVLVDEAHLLEQSFARATSDEISVFSLKNMVEANGSKALKTGMVSLFKQLVKVGKSVDKLHIGRREIRNAADYAGTECLLKMCRLIARHQKSVKDKGTRAALQEFRRKFGWLEREGGSSGTFTSRLFFTPSRRYPLVQREKLNVNRELSFLWKYVSNGVLTSATLYQHTSSGYALHDMRKELRVPPVRARAMRPICPAWVTDPVTVFLPPARPSEEHVEDLLVAPKYDAELEEWSVYYDRVAAFIEYNWQDKIAGGTLMLMTSFHAIEEVSSRLRAGPLAERVMTSERRESFRQRVKKYLQAVEADSAPIWLATGRAWTGLDLSIGARARDDHAIDYLVVPRLPVLLNCSASHRERVLSRDGKGYFGPREVWQCARQLRQGVGRLVRQRGVPEKELYVLDGRMSWATGRIFSSLRGNFSGYENQVELSMPREARPVGSVITNRQRRLSA